MGVQNDTQSKAWSSGRVLTSVQRARKQKMDRISKKQLQQRQQDYLEILENRIKYLEKRPFPADGHTVQSNYDVPSSHGETCWQSAVSSNIQDCTAFQALDSTPAKGQQSMQFPFHITPGLEYPSENGGKSMNYFRQAVRILGSVFKIDPSQVCSADHLNQDILIRAVLEGWHILQHENNVCPLWVIIREIDASINIRSGFATRLSMLRGIHQLLLVHAPSLFGDQKTYIYSVLYFHTLLKVYQLGIDQGKFNVHSDSSNSLVSKHLQQTLSDFAVP
ncbi:hypothetical protein N7533_013732 [Penicillium manginii]|uniref:uncharacterized protein n=1 Tax=Penicillium manginii TaxID=203109 RepID=UPI0025482742|nr:uncharacterized protein N7533_013732 [Penicillium manginii]KAJ5733285.1 hypothetical protein N7533_013732 [Penicillium manginii]